MIYIPITRRFEAQIKVLVSNYLSASNNILDLWSMAKEMLVGIIKPALSIPTSLIQILYNWCLIL